MTNKVTKLTKADKDLFYKARDLAPETVDLFAFAKQNNEYQIAGNERGAELVLQDLEKMRGVKEMVAKLRRELSPTAYSMLKYVVSNDK